MIRPFDRADITGVRQLWAGADGLGFGPGDSEPELKSFLERNPGLSQVALEGNQVVGAILCGHDGRRGSLYRLAVASAHRRRGLARTLVQRCLLGLHETGIPRCQVFVLNDNQVARDFWVAVGGRSRNELVMLSIEVV